jgi:hypothetical protein
MRSQNETISLSDPILYIEDFILGELEDRPTADAPKMRVVPMTINVFIVQVTVLEIHLFDQSALDEKGDGSVYRSPGNDSFLISQTEKKLVRIEVIMNREDLPNDHLPFSCVPKSLLSNVCSKSLDGIHGSAIIIETHSH